MLNRISKER